jgi:predicted aspartyl protease
MLNDASSSSSHPTKGDPETGIPFEVNRQFGSILVRAHLNGQPVTLVVDTGCSHTVLSSDFL